MPPKRRAFQSCNEEDNVLAQAPELGVLTTAFAALVADGYSGADMFNNACHILCRISRSVAQRSDDQRKRRLKQSNPRIATDLLGVAGMEEALAALGWGPSDESQDELYLSVDVDADQLLSAAVRIEGVAAWVRRRNVELARKPNDPWGNNFEFHHPFVLEQDPKFKGAIWDMEHSGWKPDGVVTFHNSPFTNFWQCRFDVKHAGQTFCFTTAEALIMAFKEHIRAAKSLSEAFASQAVKQSGSAAKQLGARATRRTDANAWSQHALHVLIGGTACLLKFSQDVGLQRFLLATQEALLVEAAPCDGAWGVGMNSSVFLANASPTYYSLGSVEASVFRFKTRNGDAIDRKYCEANALGKSLMVVRSYLVANPGSIGAETELKDVIQLVAKQLEIMQAAFDYSQALEILMQAL